MAPVDYVDYKTSWEEWAKAYPEIVNRERKVILRNGQSPGDLMAWTSAIGDLAKSYPNYKIGIECPAMEIFENSPYITQLDRNDSEVEVFNIEYPEIHVSGWNGLHFADSWRHDMEKKLGIPIKKTGIKPDLWISDEEKGWWNQVHCEFNDDSQFWVLNAGRKQDNELKQYHRYQEVVDLFNAKFDGKIKLVQIGHQDHLHPELKGVLNLVGKTNLRQLIRLIYHADGTIGPISMQMVASQAFEQPAVVIAGAKEGPRWQRNNWIRFLTNVGTLPCAKFDGCWRGGSAQGQCESLVNTDKGMVPKCFEMIKPYQIVDAMASYYEGGILKLPINV